MGSGVPSSLWPPRNFGEYILKGRKEVFDSNIRRTGY